MKKALFLFLTVALTLCLFACGKTDGEKTVVVSYYDGEILLESREYTDKIDPIDYEKEDYAFVGWYLDKDFETPFDPADAGDAFEAGAIALYAKTERVMDDFGVKIQGKLKDGAYAINPAFTWTATGDDTFYRVSLSHGEKTIESGRAYHTYYQVKEALEPGVKYEFAVEGIKSKKKSSVHFTTLAEYNNTIETITLVNPYSNGMVLQRNADAVLSGVGPANQVIALTVGEEAYFGVSDETGAFDVVLPGRDASFDPVDLVLSNGLNCKQTVSDVLFGDVYFFAGQSNMQWPTKDSDCKEEDIERLTGSGVRFFCQDVTTSETKKESVKNGRWFKPNQNRCNYFSAVATMTGSFLWETARERTPIGIVTAYQGDTNIAAWMGEEYYEGNTAKKHQYYNAMIYPLRRTNLKGVVWYQGCNNSGSGCDYKDLLHSFFRNYRELFNNDELPFFVIGLACFDGDNGNKYDFSFVRESQAKACAEDAHAYFISTCDDGNGTYQRIHPETKRYICQRVAKSIGSVLYGQDCYAEGPTYKSHSVTGDKVTIELLNAEGLYSTYAEETGITGLFLAGADGKYHAATAWLEGGKIIARSDKVPAPVYIKYGFAKSPYVKIFNKDDFAIVPFRTDEYGTNIDLFDYDSTEGYYRHPSGSEMQVNITNGNLRVTKAKDDKGFGSVRLDKWGAIAYKPEAFSVTLIGTNSGATLSVRASEGGTNETWGYAIKDDFVGEKTFKINIEEFAIMDKNNIVNNIFEPQRIGFVEFMIQSYEGVTIELVGARFVKK